MAFDREAAFGYRIDVSSGTAIRFEPGQSRKIQITTYLGRQVAYGMNNMTNGSLRSDIVRQQTMRRLKDAGYCFEGTPSRSNRRPTKNTAGSDPHARRADPAARPFRFQELTR